MLSLSRTYSPRGVAVCSLSTIHRWQSIPYQHLSFFQFIPFRVNVFIVFQKTHVYLEPQTSTFRILPSASAIYILEIVSILQERCIRYRCPATSVHSTVEQGVRVVCSCIRVVALMDSYQSHVHRQKVGDFVAYLDFPAPIEKVEYRNCLNHRLYHEASRS